MECIIRDDAYLSSNTVTALQMEHLCWSYAGLILGAGSILQIELERFNSGYKPEPTIWTGPTYHPEHQSDVILSGVEGLLFIALVT